MSNVIKNSPMVVMVTQVEEASPRQYREGLVPFALVAAYAANAGFYKVQAICPETCAVLMEWKTVAV